MSLERTYPPGGDSATTDLVAVKPADTTRNNTTTRVADPELTLAVEANTQYLIECLLFIVSSATADIRLEWEVPAGATFLWSPASNNEAGTLHRTATDTTPISTAAAGVVGIVRGYLVVGATAGSLTLKWAQGVAEVSDTVVKAGSMLKASPVDPT